MTCAVGFGAMNVFHICLADEYRGLRGLYSYWSSSLGDAVLLPTIVASLHFARTSLQPTERGSLVGTVVGTLAGLASGLNQFAWLQDPNPDLNWTLVAPHTFNAAGWYHAAFSVWLAGYCGYQLGDLVSRARESGVTKKAKVGSLTALVAAGLFTVLLAIDNAPNLDRASSKSSMVAIGGAGLTMAALAIFVATRKSARPRGTRFRNHQQLSIESPSPHHWGLTPDGHSSAGRCVEGVILRTSRGWSSAVFQMKRRAFKLQPKFPPQSRCRALFLCFRRGSRT